MTTTPTPGTSVPCPHCGAANVAAARFCESCGKALPSAVATGPRVFTGDAMPTSAAGQDLLANELAKQTKRAATTLLVIAILALIGGVIFFVLAANAPPNPAIDPKLYAVTFVIVGVIFGGLYFWARTSPLPATIVGLVIYLTFLGISVVTFLTSAQEVEGVRGSPVGCIDIIIIILLVQGVQAGLKAKRLREGRT
jgi:peptidoglycan/LPS O-acetylase OafA/YrhL